MAKSDGLSADKKAERLGVGKMSEGLSVDKKAPLVSPLAGVERKIIDANVGRFPPWIETYHLTLLTIPWTAGLIGAGWLARVSLHWLWLSSLMMFLQWFTDSFDGALGRYRNTGLRKWGFLMDHFLDFVFMTAAFVQYAFILPEPSRYVLLAVAFVYDALMVNSWLSFAATDQFKITYLGMGPTEIRLLFIILNTCLIFFGVGFLTVSLPYVLVVFSLLACFIVWRTQKGVWALDMEIKRRGEP